MADKAGGWFMASESFLARYASASLSEDDHAALLRRGHAFEREGDIHYTSYASRWAKPHRPQAELTQLSHRRADTSLQPCLRLLPSLASCGYAKHLLGSCRQFTISIDPDCNVTRISAGEFFCGP